MFRRYDNETTFERHEGEYAPCFRDCWRQVYMALTDGFPVFDDMTDELIGDMRAQMSLLDRPMQGFPEGYGSASLAERLSALAQTRIVLRPNNLEVHGDTHNKTIENYIKLALLTAGDVDTAHMYVAALVTDIEEAGLDTVRAVQLLWLWAPFSEVIGCNEAKEYFEDCALRVLEPAEYERIRSELGGLLGLDGGVDSLQLDGILSREATDIEQHVNEHFAGAGVYVTVSYRIKSMYSIWQKQERLGCHGSPLSETIYDYLGFRVVVNSYDSMTNDETHRLCLEVESVLQQLFASSWRRDYLDPKQQSGYKGIHIAWEVPEAILGNGIVAEVQIRPKSIHTKLEEGEYAYGDYAYRKPVIGKKTSQHVKRQKHRIYDWRGYAKRRLAEGGSIEHADIFRTSADTPANEIFVFDKYSNLYLSSAGETVLDAFFRIHTDKVFRLLRVQYGENGQLKPAKFSMPVWDGIRLVGTYGPEETEVRQRPNWLDYVTWPEARRRIGKYLKEGSSREYMHQGSVLVKRELEKHKLGAQHLSQVTTVEWLELARRYGLTLHSSTDDPAEIVLRGIGYGTSQPGKVVALIQTKLKKTVITDVIKATSETSPALKEIVSGLPVVRAQCCHHIAFPDGCGYIIASRTDPAGPVFRLHSIECAHMMRLAEREDPRLIAVTI